MFCQECGIQLTEGAKFCQRCGAKVIYQEPIQLKGMDSVTKEPVNTGTADLVQQTSEIPVQTTMFENIGEDFKQFVDNHIRMTTKFQSVEDILMNSKPWIFAWICVGVLTLIGFIVGVKNGQELLLSMLIFGGFFGYCATYFAGAIIRKQYRAKFYGEFEHEINLDEFLLFLNEHLGMLSPYFHKCGYLSQQGGLLMTMENEVAKSTNEVTLCCEFGSKKKKLATISIRPDIREPKSGRMQYFVGATKNGFLTDSRGAGMYSHDCLIKTAPIMQAAIEYYLKYVVEK